MQEYLDRQFCVRVAGLNVPASVVVGYDLAVTLERQLADLAAVDAPLRLLLKK